MIARAAQHVLAVAVVAAAALGGGCGDAGIPDEPTFTLPEVAIDRPADGARVTTAQVTVAGRATARSRVTVAGRRAPLVGPVSEDGLRRFRVAVPLEVGENRIVARAETADQGAVGDPATETQVTVVRTR